MQRFAGPFGSLGRSGGCRRPSRMLALTLALFGLAGAAAPGQASAQALAVPALTGPLMDFAAVVAPTEARLLQAELAAVRQDSGVQLVLLTLPTLAGEGAAPFAHRVMEAWQLGAKGSDLGLLLVVAPGDRTTRLEVGYGLEGVLPDAVAKQILADVLAPKGPQEKLTGRHLLSTVQLLHRLLGDARAKGLLPETTPDAPAAPAAMPVPLWALVLGAALALVLARYLLSFMPQEAPGPSAAPGAYGSLPGGHRRGAWRGRGSSHGLWHMLVQLLLAILSGGGRGGPGPGSGGGYTGGGGRSGGGGASDKY